MDFQPWDVAAGLLLVAESGGVVTDRDGTAANIWSRAVIAASTSVHAEGDQLAASRSNANSSAKALMPGGHSPSELLHRDDLTLSFVGRTRETMTE
ncbi:MAG: inositol monophosphatase family protein [Tepidiformaceae bacterium]